MFSASIIPSSFMWCCLPRFNICKQTPTPHHLGSEPATFIISYVICPGPDSGDFDYLGHSHSDDFSNEKLSLDSDGDSHTRQTRAPASMAISRYFTQPVFLTLILLSQSDQRFCNHVSCKYSSVFVTFSYIFCNIRSVTKFNSEKKNRQ